MATNDLILSFRNSSGKFSSVILQSTANTIVRFGAGGVIETHDLTAEIVACANTTGNFNGTGTLAQVVSRIDDAFNNKADLIGGKIPAGQLPANAIQDFLGVVTSQAAMLALTGQKGDYCSRSDLGTDWQIIGNTPTQLSSWRENVYPASPVSSVAGRTGSITLSSVDIGGLGNAATKDVGTGSTQVAAGNHSHTLAALSDDSTHRTVTDTDKSTWNAKQAALTNAATLAKITESGGKPLFNGSAWPGSSASYNVADAAARKALTGLNLHDQALQTSGFEVYIVIKPDQTATEAGWLKIGNYLSAPTYVSNPVASGTIGNYNTIYCSTGTATGFAAPTYSYVWQSSADGVTWGNPVNTRTAASYTVDPSETTKRFRCTVTATNASGSANANSNELVNSDIAPTFTGTAFITTGEPLVVGGAIGYTASVDGLTAHGSPSPDLLYEWLATGDSAGTVIGDESWSVIATGFTYTPDDSKAGLNMGVRITATNTAGSAVTYAIAGAAIDPTYGMKLGYRPVLTSLEYRDPSGSYVIYGVSNGSAMNGYFSDATTYSGSNGPLTANHQWRDSDNNPFDTTNPTTFYLSTAPAAEYVQDFISASNYWGKPEQGETFGLGQLTIQVPPYKVSGYITTDAASAGAGGTITQTEWPVFARGGTYSYQWLCGGDLMKEGTFEPGEMTFLTFFDYSPFVGIGGTCYLRIRASNDYGDTDEYSGGFTISNP